MAVAPAWRDNTTVMPHRPRPQGLSGGTTAVVRWCLSLKIRCGSRVRPGQRGASSVNSP